MDIPEEQEALFREVLTLLEEKKVPFAVSGAFALQEHTGICRWTKDLDIFLTAELVGEHWEILLWALVLFRYVYPAQSAYVPNRIWQNLLDKFRDSVSQPDSEAVFRGSLVDDNMFAIDVKEWGLADVLEEYRLRRLQSIGKLPKPTAA